jgi:hypothetical protein
MESVLAFVVDVIWTGRPVELAGIGSGGGSILGAHRVRSDERRAMRIDPRA